MSQKKHLKLLEQRQIGETGPLKFNYGFPPSPPPSDKEGSENPAPKKDYSFIARDLKSSIQYFAADIKGKYEIRNEDIKSPLDIDYIEINFTGQFDINKYFQIYYESYGLESTVFTNFGRTGLFAVIDKDLFQKFLNQVESFIKFGLEEDSSADFFNYMYYVRSFKLLTAQNIIRFELENIGDVVQLSLIDLKVSVREEEVLIESLMGFLSERGIEHSYIEESNKIETTNADKETIKLIAENFDIVYSITCAISSVITPSAFNVLRREHGFTISNSSEELPIIGIIDTGISTATPLKSIVISDSSFTIDGNPFIDVAGRGRNGHGTAIAGLAALGRENHLNQFQGEVNADAKLLSIKISDSGGGYISESKLLTMLYKARTKYPEMRLFVLTMCYSNHKETNETFSNYTYELDKFSHATGSLIFICTGNNNLCINENEDYDLEYFNLERTNLCTPADSLNNVTIGAAAENLNNNDIFHGISMGREYPTLFTRKSYIDLKSIYPKNKSNKNYFKPDVIESGGDVGIYGSNLDWADDSAMIVLSSRPEIGFVYEAGTSLSAPLVANLAAKLVREYPNLKIQTIKALIINGASLKNIKFPNHLSHLKKYTAGHGYVEVERSLFSTEDSPTIILEDIIENTEMRVYPINFPDYLVKEALGRKKSILKLTATLCFSFEPIKDNQLSYNPIHIAFSFFKNHSRQQINEKKDTLNSKLRSTLSWSQNGRDKSKPIPYINTQKLDFTVDVSQLQSESQTLKLAVQSRLTEQLIGGLPNGYPTSFPFSLVITIEENFKNTTGKLYDELLAINHLEVIQNIDLEGEIEV